MTDIPRGQGGDGSPQLDLDAIEEQMERLGGWRYSDEFRNQCLAQHVAPLLALVRRLQQENEELRDKRDAVQERAHIEHECWANAEAICDALRGRVEELTEALRGGVEAFRLTREYVGDELLPAFPGWSWFDWTEKARALLARVVPEKETP